MSGGDCARSRGCRPCRSAPPAAPPRVPPAVHARQPEGVRLCSLLPAASFSRSCGSRPRPASRSVAANYSLTATTARPCSTLPRSTPPPPAGPASGIPAIEAIALSRPAVATALSSASLTIVDASLTVDVERAGPISAYPAASTTMTAATAIVLAMRMRVCLNRRR
jgi:hypothetical protein